ncbi:MAG TPA: hypothetical protein VFZ25_10615 [Chloroflexota bacterium]|nr:hypothetical protein [Chloroflexota bacterium]
MDLIFERGRNDAPVGHALIYFTRPTDATVTATYVVVLPINLDLSKYVPPMLAGQLPLPDVQALSAVPLPPIPEPVESREALERLAELRQDDLIAGGSLTASDLTGGMTRVGEIAAQYAQMYASYLQRAPNVVAEPVPDSVSELTANDIIYDLMSEQQKLAELAKLAGQLRYAVDGGDRRQVADLVSDIERLARRLPATYDLSSFLAVAQRSDAKSQRLAALYLERCYKLASEDYESLARVDEQIQRLKSGS